jgi:DNA replication protein DnaC
MTQLEELYKQLKFVSTPEKINPEHALALINIFEEELRMRNARRIELFLKYSGIKVIKRIEDFDWTFNPKNPKNKFMQFRNSDWITESRNLVLIGPTGIGKTHLADGLCLDAINQGTRVFRISCDELVRKIRTSRNKYSVIRYCSTVKVFCLDELGYVFPSQEEANDIFQIISKRCEMLPTLVTTNLVPSQWGKVFESSTASAILDRLSLKGAFLTMEGKSYRSRVK